MIPDPVEGSEYTIGDKPELQVTLRRMPDGRWLFDSETVAELPAMGMTLYRQAIASPPSKEESEISGGVPDAAGDVSHLHRSREDAAISTWRPAVST